MTFSKSKSDLRFRMPAEWEPHEACWLAWPWDGSLWQEDMVPAQEEFTALCRAIGQSERLEILVANPETQKLAEKALAGLQFGIIRYPSGIFGCETLLHFLFGIRPRVNLDWWHRALSSMAGEKSTSSKTTHSDRRTHRSKKRIQGFCLSLDFGRRLG